MYTRIRCQQLNKRMKHVMKSDFVFDLIDKYEFFSKSGEVNPITDDDFNLFCEEYKGNSSERDSNLRRYLITNPSLFRTTLPPSQWSLMIGFQLMWYYDEIIISDPVLELIRLELNNLEDRKYKIQELLSFLTSYKEAISGGFIIFAGNEIYPNKSGIFENESTELIELDEVINAYEAITYLVKKPSKLNEDPNDNLTQLELMYQGLWGRIRTMGMYIPEHVLNSGKLSNGVFYDFVSPYERLTKEELISFGKSDMLESLKKEYSKDISVILETIINAQNFNLPTLFFREADLTAAKSFNQLKSINNPLTDTTVYDCLLPSLQNIPPERLFDFRNDMPEIFNEFRAFLYELVKRIMSNTEDPAEIKFKIDSQIQKEFRALEIEMENIKKKWVFHGVKTPLLLVLGSLSMISSGFDYSILLSKILGSGSILKGLSASNTKKIEKNKTKLNPVYFLWKINEKG